MPTLRFAVVMFLAYLTVSCTSADEPLFTEVSADESGVGFTNRVPEDERANIMTYEYHYNGGGVAVGDLNNDGLDDLYLTGNAVPNKLYLNRSVPGEQGFRFEDVTDRAGVAGRERWKTGVAMADVNADGWLDIYVCYSGNAPAEGMGKPVIRDYEGRANQLFINNHDLTFTERAHEYGLDAPGTFSTQATFFDYDRDGDLDMFLLNHANMFYSPFLNTRKLRGTRHPYFGNRLYRNNKGHFTEVSDQAGILGSGLNFGLSVSVSDLNDDGWPDLYVTNDYDEQDFCYLNDQDGTFTESAKILFGHISKYSMGSDIADINNDSRPDVMVVDMLPEDNYRQKVLRGPDDYDKYHLLVDSGYHHQNMRNTLQLNRGAAPVGNGPNLSGDATSTIFSEIGQLAGVSNTDWSWAPLLADFDNDGYRDLMITNGYLRDFTNMDFLRYTVEDARHKARAEGRDLPVYEIVQQMPATKISNYIFRNRGDLTFSDQTKAWGLFRPTVSTGAAYTDLDNDGDLDLVINNSNEPATLYRNEARERLKNNFLTIRLEGPADNRRGIGAKLYLLTDSLTQFQEAYPVRGFQSSVSPVWHFGLGKTTRIRAVRVVWPDGRISKLTAPAVNQRLTVRWQTSTAPAKPLVPTEPRWADVTTASGLRFVHTENPYVDFKREPLLPYQLSRQGPRLATGDVNGDSLPDLFIGGAAGQAGQLFLAQPNGIFIPGPSQPWEVDRHSEDVGSVFFDADRDGDADLYVVSGGSEFAPGNAALQDRLYMNDGHGQFSKAPDALPAETTSGACVAAGDWDGDGDLDLFVGGRVVPGQYGAVPRSFLLRNDSRPGGPVRFTDVTATVAPELRQPGFVTDAVWADVTGDHKPELVVTGEWMAPFVMQYRAGRLVALPNPAPSGWWQRVLACDYDRDGDLDLVLGNAGLNLAFKASPEEPMELFVSDFNDDERLDPILSYYIQGKRYPEASRDELLTQINPLRKKFVRYAEYAQTTMNTLFDEKTLQKAHVFRAQTLASVVLRNDGQGRFTMHTLPMEAQFSAVNSLVFADLNLDGQKELVLAGNFFGYRSQYGQCDASFGVVLHPQGECLEVVPREKTGLFLPGDIRDLVALPLPGGSQQWIVARNNAPLQVLCRDVKK